MQATHIYTHRCPRLSEVRNGKGNGKAKAAQAAVAAHLGARPWVRPQVSSSSGPFAGPTAALRVLAPQRTAPPHRPSILPSLALRCAAVAFPHGRYHARPAYHLFPLHPPLLLQTEQSTSARASRLVPRCPQPSIFRPLSTDMWMGATSMIRGTPPYLSWSPIAQMLAAKALPC
jgi:hypothetical protein